jgi:hypothetical protein
LVAIVAPQAGEVPRRSGKLVVALAWPEVDERRSASVSSTRKKRLRGELKCPASLASGSSKEEVLEEEAKTAVVLV